MNDNKNTSNYNNPPLGEGGFSSSSGATGFGSVYFIGIGGIGMSALARYFHHKGAVVTGYDKTETPLTVQLEQAGIDIHYEEQAEIIPKDVELVVYTPAIQAEHKELMYYREHNYKVVKRSDVLQWITENSYNICVGGTHGKTTVSTMIAHILRDSGYGCNAFLGGISANYQTNFWASEKNVVVVEADEYDRSFLKLSPDVAVITAMDADHLDIYGTAEEVEKAYVQFSQKIKQGGCLISKHGLNKTDELKADTKYAYSYDNASADVYATNLRVENDAYKVDIISKDWQLLDIVLHMGGLYNIENSVAAITVAKYLQIKDEKIKAAVENFKGVKRRFEYVLGPSPSPQGEGWGEANSPLHPLEETGDGSNSPLHLWRGVGGEGVILIDDYAHHPEEIKALINGIRSLYGSKKCTLVFQPHLYTRTKDLADAFAESLSLADEVILLPIYPARELPIKGVSSQLILDKIKIENKKIATKEELISIIKKEKPVLLVMCGAGDIDALVQPVKEALLNK